MLLLKAWNYCFTHPRQYVWFIRKERVDLEDSTMRDFTEYFGLDIPSDRNFVFPHNKSIISFRHGGEVTRNNLKNVNLSAVFIEQAEEFETDEQFQLLRGRIRRRNAPYHQINIAANTNGHNWIWKLWKNNPPSKAYELIEANSFENTDNLPRDTIEDWERMRIDAPNQYKRYILNSWEESTGDDYLFTWEMLDTSRKLHMPKESHKTIIGVDVARFGSDKTAFAAIRDTGHDRWEQILSEAYDKKDTRWTFGYYVDLRKRIHAHFGVIDDVGVGGGVVDSCRELGLDIVAFIANAKPKDEDMYADARTEAYFILRDLIETQRLKIADDEELIDELLTLRFKYKKGRRVLVSKDEMRKEGVKSPDKADALMMIVYYRSRPIMQQVLRRLPSAMRDTVNAGFGFSEV